MRVAVHIPPDHPEHGGGVEGNAVVAYRLGRIEDGVHNAPIGHDPVPLEEFTQKLLEQARAEFPGCDVRLERLIDNGDGTSSWIDAEEFDPDIHTAQGAGNTKSAEIHVTNEQEGDA
jgi:hypothetical protein